MCMMAGCTVASCTIPFHHSVMPVSWQAEAQTISTLSFSHGCCLDQGHGHYRENGLQVDIDEPELSFSAFRKSLPGAEVFIMKRTIRST